jgi:hypothetical protein
MKETTEYYAEQAARNARRLCFWKCASLVVAAMSGVIMVHAMYSVAKQVCAAPEMSRPARIGTHNQ